MSEPFLGEIRIISFPLAPKGWAFCNGQLLPINQNQALFFILGTNYGGDGRVNFALPDLRGRIPFHFGGGSLQTLGQRGGQAAHTLTLQELPTHTHALGASSEEPTQASPQNGVWAKQLSGGYGPADALTPMHPQTTTPTGGSQAHTNMPPYLVLYFVIALTGIFPSTT